MVEVGTNEGRAARGPVWALVGLTLLVLLANIAYYFPRVVDDLFISLRYAENLARGEGIVFNPGERVEGYSSPLWMFAQAFGYLFGFEGVTWTKVLGLGSLAAVLLGVYRLARELLDARPVAALIAVLFAACNSYLVDWALLGLETPGYLALLVWYPVVLRRYLLAPQRRSAIIAGVVAVALAMARPEAPLFIATLALAELTAGRTPLREALRPRVVAGLRLALPVLGVLLLLLLARRSYFGLWLPHTYYVKGASAGFDVNKLAPLVDQGVGQLERMLYLGGIAIALVMAALRTPAVLAVLLSSLYFTASVERDWMPSLRHLLPLTLFAPLAFSWAIDRLTRLRARAPGYVAAVLLSLVVVGAGAEVALVDVRFSPEDKHNRPWALPKSEAKLRDVWDVMRRIEPAHVTAMGSYDMGMITQNYRTMEAAAQPVQESWFLGRDIGKVGFYTEVRVWDTAGLFTPDVVQSDGWRLERKVDEALIRKGFALKPVAAELYDDFGPAAGRHQDLLRNFDVLVGSRFQPIDLVQNDRPLPTPHEVLRRYQASLAKFPAWFYLSTLYGEAVGAAMRKRTRIVREYVQGLPRAAQTTAPNLDAQHGAGATFAGAAQSLGCRMWPQPVKAGAFVNVTCWFRALAPLHTRYDLFMHFHDPAGGLRFGGDHPPAASLHPTNRWQPGELVVDNARVHVPEDAPAGTYKLFFGLWRADHRAPVTPVALHDGKNRVAAGTLQVVR